MALAIREWSNRRTAEYACAGAPKKETADQRWSAAALWNLRRARVARSSDYFFAPRIASLAALAMQNFTRVLAGTLMVWPFFSPNCMTISRGLLLASTSLPIPGIWKLFFACL